ncbi:hypothetical protein PVAND_007905 [Polypedilum vanderplanki]|uniref:Mrg-binding protein n=1 Tax=Polypedilum vanderplanki TaxID=319348 RepID=A0A9J6C8F0_POLVA|nr:hypothetical protein PVAND_007905 [Polypedilum vanderplanki]
MLSTEDEWTTEEEIQLFLALHGLRPVGINKHFFMVCIVDRLQKTLSRKISSEQIWKHLKTMYNLKALDDQEPLPFPNNEENFDLPVELQKIGKSKRSESESGESSKEKEIERKTNTSSSSSTVAKTNSTTSNSKGSSSSLERNERKSNKAPTESSERVHPKRTRGSIHHDAADGNNSSPASTPPPQSIKRRRI